MESRPSKPTSVASGPAFWTWQAAAGLAAVFALFFLLTSGIPLVQAGLWPDVTKKTAMKLMRISLAIFCGLLVSARWKLGESDFKRLRPVSWLEAFLKAPALFQFSFFYFLYAASLITVTLTAHAALLTRAFDLGIFAQAIWNTLQGDFLYSSLKGGICLLGDHMSPLLALISPLYALWPDPRTLIILQVLVSATRIFFVGFLAKDKLKDPFAVFTLVVMYCFFLPARNTLHEDFHPEVLVEPLMFAAFLFLEKRRLAWGSLCLALIASGKEGMLGVTFILGLYGFLFKRARLWGACVMGLSVLIFWLAVQWIIPELSGQKYFYQAFFSNLKTPAGMLQPFLSAERYEYVLKIFGPFLFLPFFHFPTLLLAFPILFQNLLSHADTTRSFGFHYTVGLSSFVFISAIYGWAAASRRVGWMQRHMKSVACLMLFIALNQSGVSEYYSFWQGAKQFSDHRRLIRQKLEAIGPQYSVLTHNNFIPHLANRKHVYMFAYPGIPNKVEQAKKLGAEVVIFDEDFWEGPTMSPEEAAGGLLAAGYRKEYQEGKFSIFHKIFPEGP